MASVLLLKLAELSSASLVHVCLVIEVVDAKVRFHDLLRVRVTLLLGLILSYLLMVEGRVNIEPALAQ